MIILILFIYLFIYLFICLFYFYSLFVPFLQSTRFCDCASSLFYNCIGFVFLYDVECLQFAITFWWLQLKNIFLIFVCTTDTFVHLFAKPRKVFTSGKLFYLLQSNVFCKSFYFPNLNPVCNNVTSYD